MHWPSSQHFDGERGLAEGAVGYLWNLDPRQAVGGLAFVESGASGLALVEVRGGIRFRYRFWLNDLLSLDASPGVVFAGTASVGFSGDLAFNFADLVAPFVRLEALQSAPPPVGGAGVGEPIPVPPDPNRTVMSAGLRFGSYATPVIAAALLVALPVAAIVVRGHD